MDVLGGINMKVSEMLLFCAFGMDFSIEGGRLRFLGELQIRRHLFRVVYEPGYAPASPSP